MSTLWQILEIFQGKKFLAGDLIEDIQSMRLLLERTYPSVSQPLKIIILHGAQIYSTTLGYK